MFKHLITALAIIALTGCAELFTIAIPIAVVSFTRAATETTPTPTPTPTKEQNENGNND